MNGGVLPLTSNANAPVCGLINVLISGLLAESLRKTVPLIGAPVAATPDTVEAEVEVVVPPPLPHPAITLAVIIAAAIARFIMKSSPLIASASEV